MMHPWLCQVAQSADLILSDLLRQDAGGIIVHPHGILACKFHCTKKPL